MNISPKVLGFLRAVVSVAVWSAAVSVLSFFSDATHFNGLLNDSLAALVAGLASMLEHQLEAKNGNALFGAVRSRGY